MDRSGSSVGQVHNQLTWRDALVPRAVAVSRNTVAATSSTKGRVTGRFHGSVPITAPTRVDRTSADDFLVREIARGNEAAMRVFYQRYEIRVYRFVLRMLRDRAEAEDALIEVFLDVWRGAKSFAGRSSISTWLLGIARHKALTALGARSMEQLDDEMALSIVDPAPGPEDELAANDRAAILRRSLDALDPAHREIVDLVYYQGRSIAEVAELLGIPLSTVKTRMFYARRRLTALVQS